jgi:hypothetical protein
VAPSYVPPPGTGFWRVGRSPDPINFADPLDPGLLDNPNTGNRFDSPTRDYGVCYFATQLDGCFGETLARFRPDPELIAISTEDGHMPAGEVPADWRVRRLAVRVRPVETESMPVIRFRRRGPGDPGSSSDRTRGDLGLPPIPRSRRGDRTGSRSAHHPVDRKVGVQPTRRGWLTHICRGALPLAPQHGLGMLGRIPRCRA